MDLILCAECFKMAFVMIIHNLMSHIISVSLIGFLKWSCAFLINWLTPSTKSTTYFQPDFKLMPFFCCMDRWCIVLWHRYHTAVTASSICKYEHSSGEGNHSVYTLHVILKTEHFAKAYRTIHNFLNNFWLHNLAYYILNIGCPDWLGMLHQLMLQVCIHLLCDMIP